MKNKRKIIKDVGLVSSYRGCLAKGDREEGSGGGEGVVRVQGCLETIHSSCFSFLSLLGSIIIIIIIRVTVC